MYRLMEPVNWPLASSRERKCIQPAASLKSFTSSRRFSAGSGRFVNLMLLSMHLRSTLGLVHPVADLDIRTWTQMSGFIPWLLGPAGSYFCIATRLLVSALAFPWRLRGGRLLLPAWARALSFRRIFAVVQFVVLARLVSAFSSERGRRFPWHRPARGRRVEATDAGRKLRATAPSVMTTHPTRSSVLVEDRGFFFSQHVKFRVRAPSDLSVVGHRRHCWSPFFRPGWCIGPEWPPRSGPGENPKEKRDATRQSDVHSLDKQSLSQTPVWSIQGKELVLRCRSPQSNPSDFYLSGGAHNTASYGPCKQLTIRLKLESRTSQGVNAKDSRPSRNDCLVSWASAATCLGAWPPPSPKGSGLSSSCSRSLSVQPKW